MKIIFIDKDGVLNSDEYLDKVESKEIDGIENDIDVNTIKLLNKVLDETGANVVLSSSCINRRQYTELLKQLFLSHGIILGEIPFMPKAIGIKKWLEDHPETEDYVILDDEIPKSFDEKLLKHLIKIGTENGRGFGEGLQAKDVQEIIFRLGRKKEKVDDEKER